MTQDVNHIHVLDNFIQEALDFLPEEYLRNSDNFTKLMSIFLERLKVLDTSFVKLAEYRLINNAGGVNLDEIGKQMGISRNGLQDEDYRAVLIIKTLSSANGGTRPSLISVLNGVLGEGNFFTYKGDNFRFDLAVSSPCFDPSTTTDEILDLLPLPTYFRMVQMEGSPLVFKGDNDGLGLGSVHNIISDRSGSFSSLIYASKTE